jgi:acetyl-CoA carboxylase biotin carboxyl carrier protein
MSENTASAKAKEKTGAGKSAPAASAKKGPVAKPSLNMDELRELAELVNEHGFTDFEFENENIRVRLSRMTSAPVAQAVQPAAAVPAAIAPAPPAASAAPVEEAQAGDVPAGSHLITSPIVGTFYRSPSPDSPPFVEVGAKVQVGNPLCIIEAMKLMNEIESDAAGEVVKIYAENGQPVEYGQPLFAIKA